MTITTEAEWLKARLNGIGASEASAIVGCNPYMSNTDLGKNIQRTFGSGGIALMV